MSQGESLRHVSSSAWSFGDAAASLGSMPRVARNALPDGIFHVTGRGVARDAIFRDDIDYAQFVRQLLRARDEYRWTLHAYCLLPNHFHLIVEATRLDLSSGMHRLAGRYAQRFNERYDRVGHVFQNRFSSYVIESEEHFARALAYVHANPIEAGLCAQAEEWRWSSRPSDSD
jgi:putative transposase